VRRGDPGAAANVAVNPALLAEAGACGTDATTSRRPGPVRRPAASPGPAKRDPGARDPGSILTCLQSSAKPRPRLRCSGACKGAPSPRPMRRVARLLRLGLKFALVSASAAPEQFAKGAAATRGGSGIAVTGPLATG
jgi:hypothetical protein